jgi:Ca-activated chloride channel family protein
VLFPALMLLLVDAWRTDGGRATRLRRWLHLSAVAVLAVSLPRPVAAQERDPVVLYRDGKLLQAAGRWRQLMAEGDRRPVTLYNLGTALLAADSLVPAIEMLERATLSGDPDIRQKALFNLGLAHLKRGSRSEAPDTHELDAAIASYRALLLQRGNDADAKWNSELALQKKRQGGGGSRNDPSQNPQQSPRSPQEQRKGMSQQQAEQLLSAAARDEKESQARRQKGMRQERAPGAKDW